MRATTSFGDRLVESITCASGVGRSGATARFASRASRCAMSQERSGRLTSIPFSFNCLWRLIARSSALAVRNTFSVAAGKTTLPMSRPSATRPGQRAKSRWRWSKAVRTAGRAATRDAASPACSVRSFGRNLRVVEVDPLQLSGRSETHVEVRREGGQPVRIGEIDPFAQRGQSHEPVQRAAIEVMPAQGCGQLAADRALAGAAGAVDRDDRRLALAH